MRVKIKKLLKENQSTYTDEQVEKARVILGRLIDTTLTKPSIDVNTFADPEDEIDKDRYKWFRYNPSEYIEAYADSEGSEMQFDAFDKEARKYTDLRDPKQTTLLYYLYRGVYKQDGKFHIGQGENIDAVLKEIRTRANAFVDAIGDYQLLTDVFCSDFASVRDNVDAFSSKQSESSIASEFMSKGAPGSFKRLQFSKFRGGAVFGTTNTKGIEGTRDHMYKGTPEFDNIPDEHKPYFLFEYLWMACYNLAQADGLKQQVEVPPLDSFTFATNYLDGLTKAEDKASRDSVHPVSKQLSKASPQSYERIMGMVDPFIQAIMYPEKLVQPFQKPVSEMTDDEALDQMDVEFNQILEKTKQALKMDVYPSTMITLLRMADRIPESLLDKFERKINRTIKGMELAGYLDENGEFTDKVENKDVTLQESRKRIKVRIIGG